MTENTDIDRVMIDIETLGLDPGAAILSLAAVRFDEDGLGERFGRSVDLATCQEAGLTLDAETLEWWLEQDTAAKMILTGGVPLSEALLELAEFYDDADEIWANSPSFDCEMLERAYDAVGETEPWAYHEERCFRTLASLPVAPELDHKGVEHNALDDAIHQARVAAATLRRLDGAASDAEHDERDP
jgi:hypothetical protein